MSNSSEYSNREVLEAVYDIRDRVTRIEEKLNRAERVEEKVNHLSEKIIEVKDLAEEALSIAKKVKEDMDAQDRRQKEEINSIKSANRWAWGFVLTVAVGIISAYFGLNS